MPSTKTERKEGGRGCAIVAKRWPIHWHGERHDGDSWDTRDDGPFLEAIVIDDQGWIRNSEGWTSVDPEAVRATTLSPLRGLEEFAQAQGVQRTGAGPTIQGEPTERFFLRRPDYGSDLIATVDDIVRSDPGRAALFEPLREIYEEAFGEFELLVGEQTGRVYRFVATIEGPNLSVTSTTDFIEYGQPVTIEPPVP